MTTYAADEDGAVVCVDCLHGACVTPSGYQCEADECQCECRDIDDPDTALGALYRARQLESEATLG